MKSQNSVWWMRIFFALMILAFVASACAPAPKPATKATLPEEFRVAYLEANKVYAQRVALDIKKSNLVRDYVNKMDEMRGTVGDELEIMNLCYVNTEDFFAAAAAGTFGEDGLGNALTTQEETNILVNALSLNELYPGDVSECQRQGTNVVVKLRAVRSEAVNIKSEIFRVDAAITDMERSEVGTAIVIQFYNKYGSDLREWIQNGDEAFSGFVGANSTEPLPADFFGFPTAALEVETRNQKVCMGYAAIYEGKTAPPMGKYAYQYPVSNDPVSGVCTLRQVAAEGYIKMILSPSIQLSNDLEEGCTSAFGCDEK
jgi:hypothetical protein